MCPKVPLDHNYKHWIIELSTDFHRAAGNPQERRVIARAIKESCEVLNLAWKKVCQWFREAIRVLELDYKLELESRNS